MGMQFRPRSPENVVNELEHWHKKGWKSFEIHDDNFTLDAVRTEKICNMLIERKMGIKWKIDNGVRADKITKILMQKMKQAGCAYLTFGIESGKDKILKVIKKGEDIESIKNAISIAKEVGIPIGATFIIGHPTETYEDFLESLEFAKSLHLSSVNFYNMVPYPGTELFAWVEKNK